MTLKLYETMEKDLNLTKYPFSLKDKMLKFPWRHHVMWSVKAPLAKAIILAAKLLPDKPTKQNCHENNTLILIDIIENRFLPRFLPKRLRNLYKAAFDIILSEIEHDEVEEFTFNFFAEEIAKEIEKGNWKLNGKGCKQKDIWKED